MTPQKYSQLKAKIVEAVPEVMVSEYILCPNCGPTPAHTTSSGGTYSIPRPITLCDILRAIHLEKPHEYMIGSDGRFSVRMVIDDSVFEDCSAVWNLSKDSLEEQSDELKEWLFTLLCEEL